MFRILLILCLTIPVFAENWINYNTIDNEIIQVLQGDGVALNICDINNTNIGAGYFIATAGERTKVLADLPYVKVDMGQAVGSRVIDYTVQEIIDYDTARASLIETGVRNGAKAYMDNFGEVDLILRALSDIIKDEINILRTLHGLPDRTLPQLKTAIKNKVDSGDAD